MDEQWEALSRRVQAILGKPLPKSPSLSDPEFARILGQIADRDPDLAESIVSFLSGTSERLPSEEEAEAERARERVRSTIIGRFFREDALRTGGRRFNLRKVINWVVGVAVVLFLVWSAIPKSPRVPHEGIKTTPPQQVEQQTAPATKGEAASTAGTQTTPSGSSQLPVPQPKAQEAGLLPNVFQRFPPVPEEQGGKGTATAVSGSSFQVPSSGGAIMYEAQPTQGGGSPVVFSGAERSEAGIQVISTASGSGEPTAAAPQEQARNVVVFEIGKPEASAASGQTSSQAVVSQAPAPSPQTGTAAPATPRKGQILRASLVVPVAVSPTWGAVPVIAEVAEGDLKGSTLFGQAVQTNDALVSITFSSLVTPDGRETPFSGVAYDPQVGRTAISGKVTTMMPGAASSIVGSVLQAASDYFNAKARSQQVTITNGWLTITQGSISFWDALAASLAKAFSPSVRQTTGPTVVTMLERGRTISVLVTS
jgi:hypothetical protein